MLALILHFAFIENKKLVKFYFSLVFSLYFYFRFNLFFNSINCPECYGDELCGFFKNQQIQLTWFSYFLSIFNPRWTKSVFHGVFNGSAVVIKRKAGRTEENNFLEVELKNNEVQRVVLCPSVTNRFFLLRQIKDGIENKRLWLDMKTSIEPLLLMYFQSHSTWPFPKYLGACGDLIIEEYKGEPLSSFLSADFKTRLKLAVQLLQLADTLTFAHSCLAFYFIDYSLENLVVDSNGEVYLIDLDSVIIANKSAFKENHLNENIHRSEILDEDKYAFSPSDICSHYLSDHNYFSVCKFLLSHPEDGLLRDIPEGINRKEELLYLLSECSLPSETNNRFSAGQNLKFLLQEITQN